MRRCLALSVTALLLLAACGSSGSDDSGGPSSTTTTTIGTEADRQLARDARPAVADAPGFQRVSPQGSELADLPSFSESVPECAYFVAQDPKRILTVRSDGLQRRTTVVDSSVAVYPDAAAAQAELELFRDPRMVECLDKLYSDDGRAVDVSPIAPNDLGDDRVAYRITPAGQPEGGTTTDVIVIRVGRVLLSVNITGTAAESAELQGTLLTKTVDRIRAAQA